MMLVAGNNVWLRKRASSPSPGMALVRVLNTSVFFGLPIASVALLWANRLIPADLPARAGFEAGCFVAAWLAVALLACATRHAQPLQGRLLMGVLGLLASGLPLVNYLTTSHGHLLVTLTQAPALAAVDLVLLASGAIFLWRAGRARPAAQRPLTNAQEKLA